MLSAVYHPPATSEVQQLVQRLGNETRHRPLSYDAFSRWIDTLSELAGERSKSTSFSFCYYRLQRSWAKVMFLQASVILSAGGWGCLPQWMLGCHTPPGSRHTQLEQTPPQSRHLPEQTPCGADPCGADTPQSRHPPEQTPPRSRHPQEQTPPRADTPQTKYTPRTKYTPGTKYAPRLSTPPQTKYITPD